jgi:predicted methyltransferase
MRLMGPLLTSKVHEALRAAAARMIAGEGTVSRVRCSLDLERSTTEVEVAADHWVFEGQRYPLLSSCKDRTIYYWNGSEFQPAARYTHALIKLVPTDWGAPTFEIDGIKMLPTAQVSPYEDARQKVGLVRPRGKLVLDTCGGLGYFASCCLEAGVARVTSYEKSSDVIWLRGLNPWSPSPDVRLQLDNADVTEAITGLPDRTFDVVLHDPPRFGIAGELYSQSFYEQLARVLKRGGSLFHYTGTPNRLTSGRDVPNEVAGRLRIAGFAPELQGDGVVARRR